MSGATPPRPRRGSEKRKRRHVVRLRVDDEERERLDGRADASGLSVSSYLRACALGDAGPRARRRFSVDRVLLAQTNVALNRIGNNVNQIARARNSGTDVSAAVIAATMRDVCATLADLRRALGYDRQG